MLKYKIGKYTFQSKEEYEAAKRDGEKMKVLASVKGTDLERCKSILKQVCHENIEFETYMGKDFIKKLSSYVKEAERTKNIWRCIWFYIKFPILSIAAAILISHFLQVPLESIRSKWTFIEMRKEKRENQPIAGNVKSSEEKVLKIGRQQALDLGIEPLGIEQVRMPILPEYETLWEKNNDLAGWLTIGHTPIDYPVMFKEEDDEFYLCHNFDKQKDQNGLLSLDKRCSLEKDGTQQIIYGHNMRSGAMFGELMNYKNRDYYKENKTIQLDTLYEKNTYKIISVFLSKIFYEDEEGFRFYNYIEFMNKKEFDSFYKAIKQMSLYEIGEEASYGDTILTLVTCEYSQDNGRLVVMAKKAE